MTEAIEAMIVSHNHETRDEVLGEKSNIRFGESTKGFQSDKLKVGLLKEGQ